MNVVRSTVRSPECLCPEEIGNFVSVRLDGTHGAKGPSILGGVKPRKPHLPETERACRCTQAHRDSYGILKVLARVTVFCRRSEGGTGRTSLVSRVPPGTPRDSWTLSSKIRDTSPWVVHLPCLVVAPWRLATRIASHAFLYHDSGVTSRHGRRLTP